MRYKTIVAASAAAAAAAAIPCGAASASTPDWLTLVNLNTGNASLLPAVCGAESAGTVVDPACAGVFGAQPSTAEAFGVELPETPQAPQAPPTSGGGVPTVANVDMRDFARWEVCGVAAGSTTEDVTCDNSVPERQPMDPGNGVSLVNADTSGALNWSVCGIAVLSEVHAFDC
ncbi:hypothetical protein [Glycomyces tenuis]|uniref:hypothetical protein n=1 Tax=Glycomyces tenuis TaxID=58116 RepID=UPI0003FFA988|nr:hypothetical protein [Glycomyces tenuis]